MRRILVLLAMLGALSTNAFAQNQQSFPRIRISFDGSSTSNSFDLGGWTRIRLMTPAPPISAASEARIYFNGTNLMISENAGAYRIFGAGNGTVTSVGLSFPSGILFNVTGSPVTTTGTLTATLNTQTANTAFRGPASGGAATPTFRAMVPADIPASTISFSHWTSNSCSTGNIPKWNGSAWACAGDDTSPGGSSWLTSGNTLGATGSKLGSLDAFDVDLIRNNGVVGTLDANGLLMAGRVRSSQTTNHAFETTTTAGGSYFGYYKMSQRTAITSGIGNPGASESVMYMDSADGHVYIKEGTATAFRVGGFTGSQTYVQWTAKQGTQPSANFATLDVRNDHPILGFSDAANDTAMFEGMIPDQWDGTTLEIAFAWVSSTATTGNVRWECSMERDDTGTDIDADSYGTVVLVTTTTAGVAGQIRGTVCSMSSAAIRDNVVAGEAFRIKIRRLGSDAGDTMTAEAQLLTIQLRHP